MIATQKISIIIHILFNASIIFLYFLTLLELSKKNTSSRTLKIQTFYCFFFILISFLFGGYYFTSLINKLDGFNFLLKTKINTFFMMPFLSFIAFLLSISLEKEIQTKSNLKKSYSIFVFILFSFSVIISFIELFG